MEQRQLSRLVEEKRLQAHRDVIHYFSRTKAGGPDARQSQEKLHVAQDDLVGFELLKIALGNADSETVDATGLYSDLLAVPGIGLSQTFRGAVISRPSLYSLFLPWVAKWENWKYLLRHLVEKHNYTSSFVNVLKSEGYRGLNCNSWTRGGKNDLVMFERRLDVMYQLLAACYDGQDLRAVVPEKLKQAIAHLNQPLEHSLRKSRYQVTARHSRNGSF
ncbi:hypothetical protein JCM5350_002467 [Sporobolomyces pararoseus]